jgi:hypothetical protein
VDRPTRARTGRGAKLNEPSTGGGDLRHRYHAHRTLEIGRIFREVFGAGDARVRPVLTGQLANPGATEEAVKWIESHHGDVKRHVYAVACAPVLRRLPRRPRGHRHAAGAVGRAPAGGGEALLARPESQTAVATRRFHDLGKRKGIRSIAYEGGADLGQAPHKVRDKVLASYVAARAAAQMHPITGEAVGEYLDWWFRSGGQEFFYYKDFSIYNRSGYWGLSNDPKRLDTPKYEAAAAAAQKYAE